MIVKFNIKPIPATMKKRIKFFDETSPPKVYLMFKKKEKTVMIMNAMADANTGSLLNSSTKIKTARKYMSVHINPTIL